MLLSVALAQEVNTEFVEPSPLAGLLPIIVMIALFYFLLIRPQQKKINEHKKMVEALRRGDKIITAGGIYGTITKVEDDVIHVEIASDVCIKLAKDTVSAVISRSKPADSGGEKKSKHNTKKK